MPVITAKLLQSLTAIPNLPDHSWYYITVIVLSVLNRPEEIPFVWQYALEHAVIPGSDSREFVDEERRWIAEGNETIGKIDKTQKKESALRVLRRCREGLLKSGGIAGLPKAINSLRTLQTAHPPYLLDPVPPSKHFPHPTARGKSLPLSSTSSSDMDTKYTPQFFLDRGNTFFNILYGRVSDKVKHNLSAAYPDLGVLAQWMYGLLLSEDTVLTAAESGYVMIASLVPQDVNAQLIGHLRGAVNHGAKREQVVAVREYCIVLCREAGVKWKGDIARL